MAKCGEAVIKGRKFKATEKDVINTFAVVELGHKLLQWVEAQEEIQDSELRAKVAETICNALKEWSPAPVPHRERLVEISQDLTIAIEEIISGSVQSEESPRT
jgi:hypothetical protein